MAIGLRATAAVLCGVTGLVLLDLAVFLAPLLLDHSPGPCKLDNEGSWAIGLFAGPSPLNLTPQSPKPALTCASVQRPYSNFVADPFLHAAPSGVLHLFFETKSNADGQGDIGVAESTDGGVSWRYLGLALDEPWHLSYPFVFTWRNSTYLLPEGAASGALRLYKAVDYPLRWQLERVLIKRPLIDTSLVEWRGRWWAFTSDLGRRGATRNGELEIYWADSPLGPWAPHAHNPVMNGDRAAGARMGGRAVVHDGRLYRWGQDCGDTYGRELVAWEVTELSEAAFEQRRVAAVWGQRGQWNSARRHHLDPLQLPDGNYLAAMDGDSQPSGPISSRVLRDAGLLAALWAAVLTAWAIQHWRGRTGYAVVGSGDVRRAGLQLSHVEKHLS